MGTVCVCNDASIVTQANYMLDKASDTLNELTDFNFKNTLFDQNINSKLKNLGDLNTVALNRYSKQVNFKDNFFDRYPLYTKYLEDSNSMTIKEKNSMDDDLDKFIRDTQNQLYNPHLY